MEEEAEEEWRREREEGAAAVAIVRHKVSLQPQGENLKCELGNCQERLILILLSMLRDGTG